MLSRATCHPPTETPVPERIDWREDGTACGTPFSHRFSDRYRSESGGLEQAQQVFLAGCGLPEAWRGQAQWRILETGFGLGLNFLVTWSNWKADPQRPGMLHFVSTEAYPASAEDVLRSATAHPDLLPLALQLKDQLWGLLPGFHRLVFEQGKVLLTICIGDTKSVLRQQAFKADSVYLDGFSPAKNPESWDLHAIKAVARCCRRGTRVASWTVARSVRDKLTQCGFLVEKTPGTPPKRDNLRAVFDPPWEPKQAARHAAVSTRQSDHCVVIGAGLAGAALAASLARRGMQVLVLDAATAPASGASGLPAGLLVPHHSSDDSMLSRLSRCGVRISLQQAAALLVPGTDWQKTGVLERSMDGVARVIPAAWAESCESTVADWMQPASSAQLAEAGLLRSSTAIWHTPAGWIKPERLVHAWLQTPGVTYRGNAEASQLVATPEGWQILDASHAVLAQAGLVLLAAGYASRALAASVCSTPLALQAIRGQITWGLHATNALKMTLPEFPVNGHGGLIPAVPGPQGLRWIMGSSYQRDSDKAEIRAQDHQDVFIRLQTLLPDTAEQLREEFNPETALGWAGIRCATPGRLPVLECLAATPSGAETWVCSGMGSRGLSFAALCAELFAARLHGEPLPLERRLAQALLVERRPVSAPSASPQPDDAT